jgi:hypothetical protein
LQKSGRIGNSVPKYFTAGTTYIISLMDSCGKNILRKESSIFFIFYFNACVYKNVVKTLGTACWSNSLGS